MIKFYFEFIKCLPAIVKMLEAYQKAKAEGQVQTKLADDVKEIHNAFATKDAAKLNDLFNSK